MNLRTLSVCGSLCGAVTLALAATPARAGLTIVSEKIEGGRTHTSTIYADADHLRAEGEGHGDGPHMVILDPAAKKMIAVDPTKKTYFEIPAELIQDHGEGPRFDNDQRADIEERLKTLPPEQRARVAAMMQRQPGGGMRPPVAARMPHDLKFQATGAKRTVNGFTCETYKVTDGGKPYEEDCIAPFGGSTVTREDLAVFKKVGEAFGTGGALARATHEFEKYPGFPIVRVRLGEGGEKLGEETVKSIKHGPLAADLFKIPAGYTQSKMPMGRGPH